MSHDTMHGMVFQLHMVPNSALISSSSQYNDTLCAFSRKRIGAAYTKK
jgi:hypothetical protein